MATSTYSQKMKALLLAIAVVALAAIAVIGYSSDLSRGAQAADSSTTSTQQSTISVSGIGTVNVVPDEALVDLGVYTQGHNASQVLNNNSAAMTAVISAIKGLGINSSDIQTQQFNFGPTYTYQNNGTSTISGYQATNTVQVTLQGSESSEVGTVINSALNAGANQVLNVGYTISSSLQAHLQNEAMSLAVGNANGTARGVASSEGVNVTGIQNIIVLSSSYPPYFYNTYSVYATTTTMAGPYNYTPPINPGQAQYTVNIEVTYYIS
jgi:uncharacterized protein